MRIDGRPFVLWPQPGAPEHPNEPAPDAFANTVHSERSGDERLIATLQTEIAYLRQTLDAEITSHTEEIRRRDHIIAGLVERVRELPATTAQNAPQDANPGTLRDDSPVVAPETLLDRVRRFLGLT